jgi:isopentenyldiphosphate isomerase
MSFLDRIKDCNGYNLEHFLPFLVDDVRFGFVHREVVSQLKSFSKVFDLQTNAVHLHQNLSNYNERTAAMASVVNALSKDGMIKGCYHEAYPVTRNFDHPASFEIERAAAPFFGICAFGVHINGYFEKDGEIMMWVARRARDKPSFPGMLDHLAAGGQPVGLGLLENVIKECGEEAGVPEELAALAEPKGKISYCKEYQKRLRPDTMFVFDLQLPEDFVPHNTDGEVDDFELWPIQKVLETVEHTRKYKPNCNLVIIDFLIRHGSISTDHPDFDVIRSGLNTQLP